MGLEPVDYERCQAEKRTGSFMTIGPRKTERCKNRPLYVATEKKPSKIDGEIGSMSLCHSCLEIFYHVMGANYADIKLIEK